MATRALRRNTEAAVNVRPNEKALKRARRHSGLVDKGRAMVEPHIATIVKALIARAEGDSRDANSAAAILLDRLWPRSAIDQTLISRGFSVAIGTAQDIRCSMARVVQAIANRELGFGEGKELLAALERLLVVEQASAIDDLKDQIDDLRREARGGGRIINLPGEDVPAWGVAGRRSLQQAETIEPISEGN